MTPAERRLLDAAERISRNEPTFEDLAYMARELVQVTLPHRSPGDVPAWSRRNGNLTMTVRPGWNTTAGRSFGYPCGTIPRLLLFWLTAEAKKRGARRIELGRSLADFMFRLGLNPATGRGPRGDATRLQDQMDRLFNAVISFEYAYEKEGRRGEGRVNMTIASKTLLWWSPRDPAQAALWGSWVELSKEFFDAITAHPVPLDMRALKALKRSPLALDLYAWLTYEAYRANKTGKGRFVAWSLLAKQMGDDYKEARNFRQKARVALRKIQALYPALKLGPMRGGIRVEPTSLPAITPRQVPNIDP